jgi:hypothetical protein
MAFVAPGEKIVVMVSSGRDDREVFRAETTRTSSASSWTPPMPKRAEHGRRRRAAAVTPRSSARSWT